MHNVCQNSVNQHMCAKIGFCTSSHLFLVTCHDGRISILHHEIALLNSIVTVYNAQQINYEIVLSSKVDITVTPQRNGPGYTSGLSQ